jgi:endonuclease/exonuclease/phosphatase family metal-dependent hydrolase
MVQRALILSVILALACCARPARLHQLPSATIRVATFNTSLFAENDGGLIARLKTGDERARKITAIIQTVRPDILLLNEFDYDAHGEAARIFLRDYLGVGQPGRMPIEYAAAYFGPVNTGVASGLDLDGDGKASGPADAWGFGTHPGEYGMLVLSKFPIDRARVRTFQMLKWRDMPGASIPRRLDGTPFYSNTTWSQLRLSSKSHWDIPIAAPFGTLHFLTAHPTPPVFDGPEDRNGLRNHDEVRMWADYLDPSKASYLSDDAGTPGGLAADALFVIAGDLNADPNDGDGVAGTMMQLLGNPRIRATPVPQSIGAAEAAAREGGANAQRRTDPRTDTVSIAPEVGNLRIDYVLPSVDLEIVNSGVFWPAAADSDAVLLDATDHHMVWIDVRRR